jgi:hypothetical protein
VAGSCEHGNELSCSTKCEELLDQFKKQCLLKKHFSQLSYLNYSFLSYGIFFLLLAFWGLKLKSQSSNMPILINLQAALKSIRLPIKRRLSFRTCMSDTAKLHCDAGAIPDCRHTCYFQSALYLASMPTVHGYRGRTK